MQSEVMRQHPRRIFGRRSCATTPEGDAGEAKRTCGTIPPSPPINKYTRCVYLLIGRRGRDSSHNKIDNTRIVHDH